METHRQVHVKRGDADTENGNISLRIPTSPSVNVFVSTAQRFRI